MWALCDTPSALISNERNALYFISIIFKFEHTSVIWKYVMSADTNMLECIQWKLTTLCFYCCCHCYHYIYANALE
jgi:hypothetical protein